MKRFFTFVLVLFSISSFLRAEDDVKFRVTPSGRALIDGAFYVAGTEDAFKNGMAISEARLGVKMQYGKWSSWIDVGFAYARIGLRNMWIQYDFNSHHSLRIGNFLQPFGIQGVSTTSLKSTFEQPLASALFTPGLRLGGMYTFQNKSFYSSTSFHVESGALTQVMNYPEFNKQGLTLVSRFVWRNRSEGDGNQLIQIGVSGAISSPERRTEDGIDIHDSFSNSANFPTKVSNKEAIGVKVDKARLLIKATPELLLSKGKLAAQAQYFIQGVKRKDNLDTYISQSGYVTLRGIIFGQDYGYDPVGAQLGNPKKNTLECVLDYNYATLSDKKAMIYGGKANSFNVTFNYYFNPYITARLNYSHTHVWDKYDSEPLTQNAIQARIMVLF